MGSALVRCVSELADLDIRTAEGHRQFAAYFALSLCWWQLYMNPKLIQHGLPIRDDVDKAYQRYRDSLKYAETF